MPQDYEITGGASAGRTTVQKMIEQDGYLTAVVLNQTAPALPTESCAGKVSICKPDDTVYPYKKAYELMPWDLFTLTASQRWYGRFFVKRGWVISVDYSSPEAASAISCGAQVE